MPASSSSPIGPAIGHLVQLSGDAAAGRRGLLGVLGRLADPRHRRGVRHRLAVIVGLALCAVVAGARSFTAIAEWAADADEQTLRMLGVTGAVPSESTFRRTLQRLDADAFDDLAGGWAQQATRPGPRQRRVIAVDGRPYAARPAAVNRGIICWLPSITLTAPCWPRWRWARRPMRSRCSPCCWTGLISRVLSSPPMRCMPSAPTPPIWRGGARITCSPSSATSPACPPGSPPCPGGRSPSPTTAASAGTG